jgi:hypothetical protein
MKFKSLLVLSQCLLIQISVKSQAWTLKKDKDGIRVYSRESTNSKFNELKVECEIEGSLSKLAAVLLDVNNHGEWVYKTVKCELLHASAANDILFYTEIECPWPFQNRDVVVRVNLTQDSISKVLTIIDQSVPGYLPDKENIVRMKYSRVTWIVTPINATHLKIDYWVQIDPGGSIPAWLLNSFASKGPIESFTKLKQEIKLPRYANAKFAFLRD